MDKKREKLKELVQGILKNSFERLDDKIDHLLDSDAVDIKNWEENMILPKCIINAMLQQEATQYDAKGTSFEKKIKKLTNQIRNNYYE